MKIIIDIDKLDNSGVCVGCLNSDRKMYSNSKIKECFKVLADIEIPDDLTAKVCWECMAYINNMFRFKDTIERSYGVLSDFYLTHNSLENVSEVCENIPQRLGLMKEQIVDIPSDLHIPEDEIAIKLEKAWDFDSVDDEDLNEDPILSMPVEGSGSINEMLKNFNVHLVPMKQGQIVKNETPNPNLIKTDSVTRSEPLYVCKFCQFKCTQKSILKEHLNTHMDNESFSCVQCSYTCADELSLNSHMNTHLGKDFSHQSIDEPSPEENIPNDDEKTYNCEICSYKSTQRANLRRHMFTHKSEKPFKCGKCSYQCIERRSLAKHVCSTAIKNENESLTNERLDQFHRTEASAIDSKEGDDKPFSCKICPYKSTLKGNLKRHMFTHSSEKPYKCRTCSYQCINKLSMEKHVCSPDSKPHSYVKVDPEGNRTGQSTDESMEMRELETLPIKFEREPGDNSEHIRKATSSLQEQSKEKPFKCQICSYTSAKKGSLKRHMYRHSNDKPFKCGTCFYQCIDRRRLERHVQRACLPPPRKPYACQLCPYKAYQKTFLKKHLSKAHRDKKLHICEHCCYHSINQKSYDNHMCKYKEDQTLKCKLCSNEFGDRLSLRKHMRSHAALNQICCEYCGMTGTKSTLELHIRTHTGERPYVCDICPFKSSKKCNLMSHVRRVHYGEKPFRCDYCQYRCADKNNMGVHLLTHTGEKPFSCNLCSYKSITSSNLKKHIRTHTGEKLYSCPYCSHKFALNSTLKVHIRTHTDERPYSCKFCSYKSRVSYHMKKHTKRQHTIKEPIAT